MRAIMSNAFVIHPFLIFLVGGLLTVFLKGTARNVVVLAVPLLSLALLLAVPYGVYFRYEFLGLDLALFRADKLSVLFAVAFHIAAFAAAVYGIHLKENKDLAAGLIYAGGALGAVFAYDLLTLYFFWEMMAFASAVIIWRRDNEAALAAGFRYLLFHLAGGLVLLIGIIFYISANGSAAFGHIGLEQSGAWLILIGFGVNAALPFLHTWLTDAYPRAGVLGTVLLSAFTTKAAIYTLIRGFGGAEPLILIGAVMAAFPIFYTVIENDLRRVLAYSLISQLGFMVVCVGIGSDAALNAAAAQAFVHVMFKSLLFMGMGSVLQQAGTVKADELGGLFRYMPFTAVCVLVGALSVSAFPLFSAFVTKSMVISATAYAGLSGVWLVLLAASVGSVHYAIVRVFLLPFFGQDKGLRPKEAPSNMLFAMGLLAFINIAIGIFPQGLFGLLPYETSYNAYTLDHIVTQLQLVFFALLGFAILKKYGLFPANVRAVNLDADFFYRKAFAGFVWFADNVFIKFMDFWKGLFFSGVPNLINRIYRTSCEYVILMICPADRRRAHREKAAAGEDPFVEISEYWSGGLSVLLICIFLLIFLVGFLAQRSF